MGDNIFEQQYIVLIYKHKNFLFWFCSIFGLFFLPIRSIFEKKKKKIRINFDDDLHHVDLSFFFILLLLSSPFFL
ncbi:hypothetical protein C1646_702088 [Rhizophagus diaphanus]|nr:hypothetical protein C1646_702088 [Rhizophagus diaphanus] [Rhizophagus sp. MUCL 43196]